MSKREISATDGARRFGSGSEVKEMLRRHEVDSGWSTELKALRDLVEVGEQG